jgi:hypothetical protein
MNKSSFENSFELVKEKTEYLRDEYMQEVAFKIKMEVNIQNLGEELPSTTQTFGSG